MKSDLDILNPVATLTIDGEVIEVRELRWRDYLRLIREMTATAFALFSGTKLDVAKIVGGELALDKDKIIAAIGQQEELMAWVIEKATSLKSEKIPELSTTQALAILDKIAELNLREELLTRGKALAGRMGGLFGVTNPSPEQQTALSAPATASKQ